MKKQLLAGALCLLVSISASAQYSDIANGIANVIMPAISGSARYKGFVEANYTQGIGKYRTNFATLSTSQGYQMTDWFYLGAGLGVDLLWSYYDNDWNDHWGPGTPNWDEQSYTSSAVMIPVFTDFRFNIGGRDETSFFIDLKVGAAFLCTDDYVKIRNGYLTNTTYFYFQPAMGLRVPVFRGDPKKAVNVGVHYRLITSDYWSGYQSSVVLSGLGLDVSFEW